MIRTVKLAASVAVGMTLMSPVFADPAAKIREVFAKRFPQIEITNISETPVKGVYQAAMNSGELLYVSADAQYVFSGDLMQLGANGMVNLSEGWRSEQRVGALNELKDKDLVIFPAKGEEKGEVVVFTDTSCGYCRKFHTEIPALNAAGVTVKYAAWPRYGVASDAGKTMTNIWCSDDRAAAMDKAKSNQPVSVASVKVCDTAPLEEQVKLGQTIGVRGTPAVFLMDGRQVGGYVKASDLIKQMGLN